MKRSRRLIEEFPEDYGTRTDYAGGTTAVLAEVIKLFPEAKEYWGYIKAKHPDKPDYRDRLVETDGNPVYIMEGLHHYWLKRYYELRGNDDVRFSTGMGMLLVALERLKPGRILLAGYDAILNPETDWSSTLATKKYDWDKAPPHDFAAEHEFLKQIKDFYDTEIVPC